MTRSGGSFYFLVSLGDVGEGLKTLVSRFQNRKIYLNVSLELTSKPKQVLFFFRKSFAGIPQKLRGRISLISMGLPTFYLDS